MFEEFWKQYPRKECKKPARLVWDRLTKDQQQAALDALPNHCRRWMVKGTDSEFIPHARTWLYQERWEDEIQITETITNWLQSDKGTMDKGRELGIHSKPGESMNEYRERLKMQIFNKVA